MFPLFVIILAGLYFSTSSSKSASVHDLDSVLQLAVLTYLLPVSRLLLKTSARYGYQFQAEPARHTLHCLLVWKTSTSTGFSFLPSPSFQHTRAVSVCMCVCCRGGGGGGGGGELSFDSVCCGGNQSPLHRREFLISRDVKALNLGYLIVVFLFCFVFSMGEKSFVCYSRRECKHESDLKTVQLFLCGLYFYMDAKLGQ